MSPLSQGRQSGLGLSTLGLWPTPPTLSRFSRQLGGADTKPSPAWCSLTFHSDVELAQVNFQSSLYETHVLQGPQVGQSLASPSHYPGPQSWSRESWGGEASRLAHLHALLEAAAQLLQALTGGAALGAAAEGTLHVGGAIPQTPLDTIGFIELIHLPQTFRLWATLRDSPFPTSVPSRTVS